jgi:hypothetical protein
VFASGTVLRLRDQEGCIFEPVHVLSDIELEEVIRYRVQHAELSPPVPAKNTDIEPRWVHPMLDSSQT